MTRNPDREIKMSYYAKALQPNERILYNKRLHWIVYAGATCFSLLFWLFLALIGKNNNEAHSLISIASQILICISPLMLAWIKRATTEIIVTDKRIIFKRGVIFRKTTEMNMSKVETVDVNQSIIGRILNYGTVLIRGSGSTYEVLQDVIDPLKLRNSIIVR
jgi:uncharacterized membrane protein YdbT with pleckstrin-like domain